MPRSSGYSCDHIKSYYYKAKYLVRSLFPQVQDVSWRGRQIQKGVLEMCQQHINNTQPSGIRSRDRKHQDRVFPLSQGWTGPPTERQQTPDQALCCGPTIQHTRHRSLALSLSTWTWFLWGWIQTELFLKPGFCCWRKFEWFSCSFKSFSGATKWLINMDGTKHAVSAS